MALNIISEEENGRKSSPCDILEDLLDINIDLQQNPIIYSAGYDVTFAGIEKWYPLETTKGGKVFNLLKECGLLTDANITRPKEATSKHLNIIHSELFLTTVNLSHLVEGLYLSKEAQSRVGRLADISSLTLLPSFVINHRLLKPLKLQTGGSVLAAKLALDLGWSINLGGGFNHCCSKRSGSYSPYADVTLAATYLLEKVSKVMVIDLSAQQCNGPERSFMYNKRVHILDVYNRDVYPLDGFAKRGISCRGELESNCSSKLYLETIRIKLEESLEVFSPDVVLYVAGTDVLEGDPGGCMCVSEEAIIERDQIVFLKIRSRGIPIVMLCGSGFVRGVHTTIARSIVNLHKFGLISMNTPPSPTVEKDLEEIFRHQRRDDVIGVIKSKSSSDLDLIKKPAPDINMKGDDVDPETSDLTTVSQIRGLVCRSKTFVGSLLSWTSWPYRGQPVYQSIPQSECTQELSDVQCDRLGENEKNGHS